MDLIGPIAGGERATAELVKIRTELLSADDAARKRLMCSCAFFWGGWEREERNVRLTGVRRHSGLVLKKRMGV